MQVNAQRALLLHSSFSVGRCTHCGNPVSLEPGALTPSDAFCCAGCETVYRWIESQNLGAYYDLKSRAQSLRKPTPASETDGDFAYLDDPEITDLYSWKTAEGRWMDLYVEGAHCAACVWLTEKITEMVDQVGFIRLNLGNSVATVRVDTGGSFAAVARELQKMGYRPHPVRQNEERDLQKRENRRFLIRLGIAGACAGNLMLLAVSLYSGLGGLMADRFRWISFFLFLPVLFYSAVPFYQSAWNSLRMRQVSIDVPVVFGLLVGSVVSVVNLLSGDERIYFDSLSTLIFLLLATRYLLKRTQQTALESSRLSHFLSPSQTRKWNSQTMAFEPIRADLLCVGDRAQILPNECVPADGRVIQGVSSLDCALLSGESHPKEVSEGDLVFAGTLNLDAPIEIEVSQSGASTRIGRILCSMERLVTRKASITVFTSKVSQYFVAAIVVLSMLTFAFGLHGNWHEALNRALSVAIVTCPCTFALITPLAFSLSLGRLARAGVLVKGSEVLEKIANARAIFLDKTGTLTEGLPQVFEWNLPSDLDSSILAIESQSNHPIAKAIVSYLRPRLGTQTMNSGLGSSILTIGSLPAIGRLKETMGYGIRARVGDDWLEIRRSSHPTGAHTEVSVLKNGSLAGTISFSDRLRTDSPISVKRLQRLGLETAILSGDQARPVAEVARAVGINPEQTFSELTPEQKRDKIATQPQALMVGDGANDAIALAQSSVGIAVRGGVEISLHAADVYLTRNGTESICDLVVVSRETLHVIRRNLAFSILYNIVAGGFALAGKIDPLFAAVLMPLSALTVFTSSVVGTHPLRKAMKDLNR